jgi:hypothetical protein
VRELADVCVWSRERIKCMVSKKEESKTARGEKKNGTLECCSSKVSMLFLFVGIMRVEFKVVVHDRGKSRHNKSSKRDRNGS